MIVISEKCTGCKRCFEECPLDVFTLDNGKVIISEDCTNCGACVKVCPVGALILEEEPHEEAVQCLSCPIHCQIRPRKIGACRRFTNVDGNLMHNIPLHTFEDVSEIVGKDYESPIRKPLITAIGAGTTYPDFKPAPHIVQSNVNGVDVVTVVSEAPLSYSGMLIKIDTDEYIGEEGASVFIDKTAVARCKVGHVTTEQYGSKVLSVGGPVLLTRKGGSAIVRLMVDIANRKEATLKVEDGASLKLQVGKAPSINGKTIRKMRGGCGSACAGLFAHSFLKAADEVIIIDYHITSLFTKHEAGQALGARYSGLKLKGIESTSGRYFNVAEPGSGWGGTNIDHPLDIIDHIDTGIARPGMKLLITESTGERATMYELDNVGKLHQIEPTREARATVDMISSNCEAPKVSAVFVGGSGGSARSGVTKHPVKLTQAIHENKAKLTVGGAPVFILPGGGINFFVDVSQVKVHAFTWVPTPAPVFPIEYTMRLQDYLDFGGHRESIKTLDELKQCLRKEGWIGHSGAG